MQFCQRGIGGKGRCFRRVLVGEIDSWGGSGSRCNRGLWPGTSCHGCGNGNNDKKDQHVRKVTHEPSISLGYNKDYEDFQFPETQMSDCNIGWCLAGLPDQDGSAAFFPGYTQVGADLSIWFTEGVSIVRCFLHCLHEAICAFLK